MALVSQLSSLAIGAGAYKDISCIRVDILEKPVSAQFIAHELSSIEGALDVFTWYEGTHGLPAIGADFLKERLFQPLYTLKEDARLCLYSLKAWDFSKSVDALSSTTALGESINRINQRALKCFYAADFFNYCRQVDPSSPFYRVVSEDLPKKQWLTDLSSGHRPKGLDVKTFFDAKATLLDSIQGQDVAQAYAHMQYIEAYYLLRTSIEEKLRQGQNKISVAFVLPNDESKYYKDFPQDLKRWLSADFGSELDGVDIDVIFRFFTYGSSLASRPYIDKSAKASKVDPKQVGSYFDYLEPAKKPFLKDNIHNVNGWY
jgi:hypothetical protein